MLRTSTQRMAALASAVLLMGGVGLALGDAYFQIRTTNDWEGALGTGHVYPLPEPVWQDYMQQWSLYTEEGVPYPDTDFLPADLYTYEGPEVPPDPDYPGGLVMAWGDENLPDGPYASAWMYDYLVDPDLSNAMITLTVYPPQYGQNGAITQVSFGIIDLNGNIRSWYWTCGPTGQLQWNTPTTITIFPGQTGLNAVVPPATGFLNNPGFDATQAQWFIADENGRIVGGQVPVPPPGGPPAGVWNYWYDIVVRPFDNPVDYNFEFSLDIGSDIELSDPFVDGDEAADPGDVYWWQSSPIVPPGRDGFKDDQFIFGQDPWPDPPDLSLMTAAPVGSGSIQNYWEYFDLDGHDQIDFSLTQIDFPYPQVPSQCIYTPKHLTVSFDDDMGPGWPAFDVPVTAPSFAGFIHGSTAAQDEIVGFDVGVMAVAPPFPIIGAYPIADERTVHPSLAPNPDNNVEEYDDDVDSLDVVENRDSCPIWLFSPDHEAHLGLDYSDIYEVTAGGPVLVVDEQMHLGIPDEVDIDAFEFCWLPMPDDPAGVPMLALLFSVDDDDPLTPVDESGGGDPTQVFVSWLVGFSVPFTDPMGDDVDALSIWHSPIEPPQPTGACCTAGVCTIETQANCLAMGGYYKGDWTTCGPFTCICRGDANCDGIIDFGDINAFVIAIINGVYCDGTGNNADMNGDGVVDFADINPFVALLTTVPLPIPCP